MNGSCIELIATNEIELKDVDKIASTIFAGTVYVTPDLIQIAGVARSLSNGRYKIFVMVDYPKGIHYAMDKFKGTKTDFFLADGYDVILTPGRSLIEIENEIKTIHSFVKSMVNQHAEICYTINASNRTEEEIDTCAKSFSKMPPSRIKLEASTVVQPTKANIETHKNTINLIRKSCTTPISICGNVTYNIYKELSATYKITMSPEQFKTIKKQFEAEKTTK